MEGRGKSVSGSVDINSVIESPALSSGVNVSADVAPQNTGVVGSASGSGSGSGELAKKKRGRPRKVDADGNLRANTKASPPAPESPAVFSISHPTSGGRPPASAELVADAARGGITPHVIHVSPGEDVTRKILSLIQTGVKGICVLSANGTVSSVAICHPGASGGVVTYEGRFDIISLTGSFTMSEIGGVKNWTGGFSVSLAGPNGNWIGGAITGPLVAANPILVVVGSFMPNAYRIHNRRQQDEARMVSRLSPIQSVSDATTARPNLHALAEISAGQVLPSHVQVQNHVGADNSINRVGTNPADWNSTEEPAEQKPSPDINMAAPEE